MNEDSVSWVRAGWRRYGRSAVNVVGLVLLLGLVVPFVAYGAPQLVGAAESYIVLSGSMEPAISTGDVIFVYETDPRAVAVGDVITYDTGNEVPTTHRVVEVVRTDDFPSGVAFRTKGDANEDVDPALRPGATLVGRVPAATLPWVGEVSASIPYMGYVVRFANTTVGFVLLVALPILLFVVNEGWRVAASAADRSRSGVKGAASNLRGENVPDPTAPVAAIAGVPVSHRDLTVAAGVLVLTTAYTGWQALGDVRPLPVALAVASLGALVLVVSLRRSVATAPPADSDSGATPAVDGRFVAATLPATLADLPRVVVESRDALVAHADALNRLVIDDRERGNLYLPDGDVLYTVASPRTDGGDVGGRGVENRDVDDHDDGAATDAAAADGAPDEEVTW